MKPSDLSGTSSWKSLKALNEERRCEVRKLWPRSTWQIKIGTSQSYHYSFQKYIYLKLCFWSEREKRKISWSLFTCARMKILIKISLKSSTSNWYDRSDSSIKPWQDLLQMKSISNCQHVNLVLMWYTWIPLLQSPLSKTSHART